MMRSGAPQSRPSDNSPARTSPPGGAFLISCPGRDAARSTCEALLRRTGTPVILLLEETGVPVLRSGMKNAASRPGHDDCKSPNSNFKQPRLLVLAPPRGFKLLVYLPLRGDGAPNDA